MLLLNDISQCIKNEVLISTTCDYMTKIRKPHK